MTLFDKLAERLTHRHAIEEQILQLQKESKDREVYEAEQRALQQRERELADRLCVLEQDRDELFVRFDKILSDIEKLQKADPYRAELDVLAQDRNQLFQRLDKMAAQLAALTDTVPSHSQLETIEHWSEELERRSKETNVEISLLKEKHFDDERFTVLEQDRTELFRRSDQLQSGIDTWQHRLCEMEKQQAEDISVQRYIFEKRLDNYGKLQNRGMGLNTPRIHFIRCLDIYNTGDMNCGPDLYFQEFTNQFCCFFHSIKNIDYTLIGQNDWVILGGGGMLDCSRQYQNAINRLLEINGHVISWGLGHNEHHADSIYYWGASEKIKYDKFFLFTTRDWKYGNDRFCPCVSCMMPGLERHYALKRRVGVLTHHEILIKEFDLDTCNNSRPLDEILEFIGSSEIILTNTYHGAYWATLMGKKVIIYQPFSNRFSYFKYQPMIYSGDLEKDIENAKTYPEALEECRSINRNLRDELLQIISKK